MDYEILELEDDQSDEEHRLEVLKYLTYGSRLFDLVSKDAADTRTVREHDYPAFSAKDSFYFDFPQADLLNEMIKSGLLSVDISPWNPYYDLRTFRITDVGQRYYAEHGERLQPEP